MKEKEKKRKEKYIQKARPSAYARAAALESCSLHCLFRGIAEHQSALSEKLHRKHTGIQRTTWWGAAGESEITKNATYAIGVGARIR